MRERLAGHSGGYLPEDLEITVSIGVSSCPENSTDLDGLIKAADDAMYAGKGTTKNSVTVSCVLPAPAPAPAG